MMCTYQQQHGISVSSSTFTSDVSNKAAVAAGFVNIDVNVP